MPIFPSAQDKLVRPYPFARPRAPGCTTRTFSNICLHCLTYAHTLPESREMWHFRTECVLDDMAWRTRSCNLLLSFLCPLPSRAGSLQSPEFSYGRFDLIRH